MIQLPKFLSAFALNFSHTEHLIIFLSLPMSLGPIKHTLNATGGQGNACICRAGLPLCQLFGGYSLAQVSGERCNAALARQGVADKPDSVDGCLV